ncbi:hypothetical protein GB937_006570 [Aspergillus fischeri]|nr:hypothetical protein GB937_006570 [Aspergillus fischeri]
MLYHVLPKAMESENAPSYLGSRITLSYNDPQTYGNEVAARNLYRIRTTNHLPQISFRPSNLHQHHSESAPVPSTELLKSKFHIVGQGARALTARPSRIIWAVELRSGNINLCCIFIHRVFVYRQFEGTSRLGSKTTVSFIISNQSVEPHLPH